VTSPLPLFPLGTVLFPGLVMPLQVFEERYRALIRDLVARSDNDGPREFGVVAIQRGWEVEVGTGGVTLFDVGCTAELREVTEHPDGRFDIVTVGRTPFEITRMLEADTLYLQAEVHPLVPPDPPGDTDLLGPQVLAVFQAYLRLIRTDAAEIGEQLPDDASVLSYLVAATAALTIEQRQQLLTIPDTAQRLRAELVILRREIGLLKEVRAVPATLADLPVKPVAN
jgi:Lon protease-like protein